MIQAPADVPTPTERASHAPPSQHRRWTGRVAGLLAGLMLAAAGPLSAQSAAAPAAAAPAATGGLERFARHPTINEALLSPGGRWTALRMRLGDRWGIALVDMRPDGQPRVLVRYADADVARLDWVGDDRIVFSLVDMTRGGGDQTMASGLYVVRTDLPDAAPRALVDPNIHGVREMPSSAQRPLLPPNHGLLMVPEGDAPHVLIARWQRDTKGNASMLPVMLNVDTAATRSVALGMPPRVGRVVADVQGEPRALVSYEGDRWHAWVRPPGVSDWRLLTESRSMHAPWVMNAWIGADTLLALVPTGSDGEEVLKRIDLSTGEPVGEALVSAPGFDATNALVRERGSGRLLGVRVRTDADTTAWLEPKIKALQAEADARLPGRTNHLQCARCTSDEPVVLVASWSDQEPGQYWRRLVVDGKPEWTRIGSQRSDIDPRQMATLDFHRFAARDGLQIPLWVTTPPGKATRPRPAVLLVHGGPGVRGVSWRWNGEAQAFASRGWVVLEPEFRGSTGYGIRLYRAGWKQWGGTMQDDLADAVRHAAEKGWIDPKRVCIVGGSYGGYAALMAPIRYPEMFRCSVAEFAVSEPRWLLDASDGWSDASTGSVAFLGQTLGDAQQDAELLRAASPLERAAELKVPLMLVVGAQDRRVPARHGRAMRDALTQAGSPPEWVSYADEGHGLLRDANRIDRAKRVDAFLARHLGP